MLFNKPLAELEESDLQTLVDNVVREGREIEYKEVLNIRTDEQKQEFLNDVSSFANTSGGLLFFGISESKDDAGVPLEVCGLKGENPGKRIGDMESIIRTGLEPRLLGVSMQPVFLPSHEGRTVIILSIPKSFGTLHMIRSSGRFYMRNSTGKFPLDVAQIQTAFELIGSTAERIRAFRVERLSRISTGEETPAPLDEQDPKLVLHLVPFSAFSSSSSLDLRTLYSAERGQLLRPAMIWDVESDVDMRFNFDGIVRALKQFNPPSTFAYTQVFRNGIIEAVDVSLLQINTWNTRSYGSQVELLSFHGEYYERRLVAAVKRFLTVQKLLGVDPPFFIMVSLLGVKGYKITHPKATPMHSPRIEPFDRNNQVISEVMIEDFDADIPKVMKPVFDTVWNAAGYISSPNYDDQGKFKFND